MYRLTALIKEGDWRITDDFLLLLMKKVIDDPLTQNEALRLRRYIEAISYFQPPLISKNLLKSDGIFVNDPTLISRVKAGQIVKVTNYKIVPIPFWISEVDVCENNVCIRGRYCENPNNFSQSALALIYMTREWLFNRHLGSINEDFPGAIAEMHAVVAGQLPDQILATFYPELVNYDQELAGRHKLLHKTKSASFPVNQNIPATLTLLPTAPVLAPAPVPAATPAVASVKDVSEVKPTLMAQQKLTLFHNNPQQNGNVTTASKRPDNKEYDNRELTAHLRLSVTAFVELVSEHQYLDCFFLCQQQLASSDAITAFELPKIKAIEKHLLEHFQNTI